MRQIAGVNAFIATHHGSRLPPEFTLLRFEPEPWTGVDVIVWVKMMAWDLARTIRSSCCGTTLVRAVGTGDACGNSCRHVPAEQRASLSKKALPRRPRTRTEDTVLGFPAAALTSALSRGNARLSATPPPRRSIDRILGSNNWVVDGTLSETGKPLLANDPHLGTKVPSPGISRICRPAISTSSAPRCPAHRPWPSAATGSSRGARPTSPRTSRISIENGSTTAGNSRSSAAWRSR